ncbi:hypothetical protein KAU19_00775 [Candidatus Parcubacteria bacterium]|nr:hypothetical protein [Candidatus Parcubacteria bacterium]
MVGEIKLSSGIKARSSKQLTHNPWFNCASGCSGDVKLHTPIVHNESNMFMIKIRGYGYGTGGRNKEILCSGYAYGGTTLIAEACNTIVGSTTATITTVNRDGSTYVVIVLNSGAGYYNHYTWEYIGWTAHDPDNFYWEP